MPAPGCITGRTAVRSPEGRRGEHGAQPFEIPEATWVDVTPLPAEMRAPEEGDPHYTPGLLTFIARFVTAGLKKSRAEHPIVTTEDTTGGASRDCGLRRPSRFQAQIDRGRWCRPATRTSSAPAS
jgi:pyruvate dehydrogenase E2 component (dihydrolipoamide acetyltransferase)